MSREDQQDRERGASSLVEDVETLVRLYGARAGDREQLLELARSLHATYESTRTPYVREAERAQRQIAAIEADTDLMRTFELAWVPPLLQARSTPGRSSPPAPVPAR